MTRSSRQRSIVPLGLFAVAVALGFAFGSAIGVEPAPERARASQADGAPIALFRAEPLDPAPADPFDLDPLTAPPPFDCPACAVETVRLAGGDAVALRVERTPSLQLSGEEIAFLELAEAAESVGDGARGPDPRPAVFAVFETAARARLEALERSAARTWFLVRIGERPVDLVRPLGWTRGIRLGVFADDPAREAFVETLPFSAAPTRHPTRDAPDPAPNDRTPPPIDPSRPRGRHPLEPGHPVPVVQRERPE